MPKRKVAAEPEPEHWDLYTPMPNPQWRDVRLPDGTPSVPIERMEAVVKAVIAERLAKGEARRKRDAKR